MATELPAAHTTPSTPPEGRLPEAWEWPRGLDDLVAKHGGRAVYAVGLQALGYPPTWSTSGAEFVTVKRALQQEFSQNPA